MLHIKNFLFHHIFLLAFLHLVFCLIENTLDFYNRIQIIIARTEYAIESLQNHNQQVAQFIKEIPFKFSVGENKEPFFISCAKKLSQLKPIKDSSFQLKEK